MQARVEPGDGSELVIDTGGEDGAVRYRRAGRLVFTLHGQDCGLTVLSLVQYAGGLFVPFRDPTSGRETYGGGRYLFDTAKDTDGLVLEITPGSTERDSRFQLRVQRLVRVQPALGVPARAAREPPHGAGARRGEDLQDVLGRRRRFRGRP